ncbi:HRDC domain-containing protein [uncultured Victivallis sp.]|uniref:RecQ family ATP-dependent DNA helicase n=1 Tax=uncultured Victivallis sp. TaxID=354118 RepID=UPI0025F7AA09|nr:HRDC domain-containing protein [uncultured Victivallis sp.]
MKYIKSLESCRCIGRIERGDYPCLELAPHGMEVLAGHAQAELDVPEEPLRERRRHETPDARRTAGSTGSKAAKMERHALYDALKSVRSRLAEQRGVPPFQVLSNAALADFAERQPLTVQEAMEINGIGPVKAATVVPLFLGAVRLWRAAEREARGG